MTRNESNKNKRLRVGADSPVGAPVSVEASPVVDRMPDTRGDHPVPTVGAVGAWVPRAEHEQHIAELSRTIADLRAENATLRRTDLAGSGRPE